MTGSCFSLLEIVDFDLLFLEDALFYCFHSSTFESDLAVLYPVAVTPQSERNMILLIPSSAKLVQESMCRELYLLISNPLSLMKSEVGLTDSFFTLNNLFLARKTLLITLPGDIIQVKEAFAMLS